MPSDVVGNCRIARDQFSRQRTQRLILRIGVRRGISAFQLNTNRKIIAPLASTIQRHTGVPGALIKRNILDDFTVAANQTMGRNAQMRYLSKKGIAINSRKVMSHFAQSLQEFEELYKELAK